MYELIIDSFAGGGGASTGIEMALGRSPDYAINHDDEALALHAANHPQTIHLSQNIYQVDPMDVVGHRPVGLLWASPDCKHFSKAKGGKPVKRSIRDLAWTVVLWAKRARPRVIILENVEEFQGWGPLVETSPGVFIPDSDRRGETFTAWVKALKRLGYRVEWRELRACDYGAPTTRKRLFVIARRDGRKIVWPEPTHGAPDDPDVIIGKKLSWRTAAEIIDWSLPCPSVFETSEQIMAKHGIRAVRPLAEATMARIYRGVQRYVIEAVNPFLVNLTHGARLEDAGEPFKTVTGANRGEKAVVVPSIVRTDNASAAKRNGVHSAQEPVRTMTTAPGFALVAPSIIKFQSGATGSDIEAPLPTVTANSFIKRPGGAAPIGLVAPILAGVGGRAGQSRPRSAGEPTATMTTKADTVLVAPVLSQAQQGGAVHSAEEPHRTITASPKDQNQVIAAHLMTMRNAGKPFNDADKPTHTITAGGAGLSLVAATMVQTGYGEREGQAPRALDIEAPLGTVVAGGAKHAVIAAHIQRQFGNSVGHAADEPSAAITAGAGGHSAVVAANIVGLAHGDSGGRREYDVEEPLKTVHAGGNNQALVATFMAQHNTGLVGHSAEEPVSTIVQMGSTQAVVAAGLMNMRGSARRQSDVEAPAPTLTSGGNHVAEVRAFLLKYYGNETEGHDLASPAGAVTTRDRFGLVTVHGEPYEIVDIGMRMLTPRELFKAQGFPDDYEIETGSFTMIHRENGVDTYTYEQRPLTKTAQVRMCGNSVCPPIAAALVGANVPELARQKPANDNTRRLMAA